MKTSSFWFWIVGYALFALMMGTNLPSPLYGVYMAHWHFASGLLTLIFAIYALCIIPSLVVFGQLADRVGRKAVLIPGLLAAIAGSVLFALASQVVWLFLARAIQGIAVGAISGAATAALAELHPRQNRKQAAIVASVATAAGTALGPVLAGLMAQYLAWPLRLSYVVHIALMVPALLMMLSLPETLAHRDPIGGRTLRMPSVPVDIRKPFLLAASTAFVAWAVTALFMSVVPAYVSVLLKVHNLALTGAVVFLMLGASTLTQLVVKSVTFAKTSVIGLILLMLGLAGVVWAVPTHSLAVLLVSTAISGCGQGLAFKGSMVLANEIAPVARRADVISSYYVVVYCGVGIPVIGVGYLGQAIGVYHALQWFAGWVAVVGVLLIGWISTRSRGTGQVVAARTQS